jgi:hypothetical protein
MAFMAFAGDRAVLIERADKALQLASAPTAGLFSKVMQGACARLPALKGLGSAARLERLIDAGAWAEAALALVELEMPAWSVRRLACERGEWVCSLSRQPNLPIAVDDTAEASHEVLALAILRAVIEVRRRSAAAEMKSAVPSVAASSQRMFCCDSFA